MDFWHWMAFVVIAGALVLASPKIVEQACSDEGDGWSGACPGCECHESVWNTLPPSYGKETSL